MDKKNGMLNIEEDLITGEYKNRWDIKNNICGFCKKPIPELNPTQLPIIRDGKEKWYPICRKCLAESDDPIRQDLYFMDIVEAVDELEDKDLNQLEKEEYEELKKIKDKLIGEGFACTIRENGKERFIGDRDKFKKRVARLKKIYGQGDDSSRVWNEENNEKT